MTTTVSADLQSLIVEILNERNKDIHEHHVHNILFTRMGIYCTTDFGNIKIKYSEL